MSCEQSGTFLHAPNSSLRGILLLDRVALRDLVIVFWAVAEEEDEEEQWTEVGSTGSIRR